MNNYANQARIASDAGNWKEAIELLEKAKSASPGCSSICSCLAIALLSDGRIEEGLREFESRFGTLQSNEHPMFELPNRFRKRYKAPYWDGKADLHGKTILVFNEGGHGDMFQNVRYLPFLKNRGAKVILEAREPLCKLLEGSEGIDELRSCDDSKFAMLFFGKVDQTGIDYVVSAWTLLYYFDPKLDNIPWKFPYVIPKPSESEALQLVRNSDKKLKIGIVWAGVQGHGNDFRRSMFKKEFKPLADIPGVQLFALQKGEMTRAWPQGTVNLLEDSDLGDIDLGPLLKNFNDTAAVAQELDAIVSVDTSVTHMAGAINVPIWTLLTHKKWAEWRWQKKWYASQRLVFQETYGDWCSVMNKVAKQVVYETR